MTDVAASPFAWLVLSVAFGAFGSYTLRRATRAKRRWPFVAGGAVLLLLAAVASVPSVYLFWATHRSMPGPMTRVVAPGVTYAREVRTAPRPMVLHVATVDLRTPGLELLVTPRTPTAGRQQAARTTSAFAREFDQDLAVSGGYFFPFRSNGPWDYYPKAGDACDVVGLAASRGDQYGRRPWRDGVVYLAADNRAAIDDPPAAVFNVLAGNGLLVKNGISAGPFEPGPLTHVPYPRVALGLDRSRDVMTLLVIDGKQPGYSEGATLDELASILMTMNVDVAVRLDEGGSATMAARADGGAVAVLNSPVNTRIVGRERPLANHLGVRVRR